MPLTQSTDSDVALGAHALARLAQIAAASIRHGLTEGCAWHGDPRAHADAPSGNGASFVTLRQNGALRGCMGSLERRRALTEDVAENAFAAAFRDPRFAPLCRAELAATAVEVSVLTPPLTLDFADEAELFALLRPGRDGVIIEHLGRRATYLPGVWDQLPDPRDFFRELRRKASIDHELSITELVVQRYETIHSRAVPLQP